MHADEKKFTTNARKKQARSLHFNNIKSQQLYFIQNNDRKNEVQARKKSR